MILTLDNIQTNIKVDSKGQMFEKIAQLAVKNGYSASQLAVIAGLEEREAESTTGMLDGFAIPHAKSSAIKQAGIFVFSLTEGVEWQSLDGNLIDFVICLLIPTDEAGTTHLQLLSKVARLLVKDDIKQALKAAKSPIEINEIITSNIG